MRMIPAFIDEFSPPGEKAVFSRLQSANRDWVVIHSLDLAPYNDNKRTEIDFVIVIPDRGVLCVEVKSHRDIFFDGERWQPPSIKKSPFAQAKDARYAFRRRLIDSFGESSFFASMPVVHLCMFPNSIFEVSLNMAIRDYEVMDMKVFARCKTSQAFCQEISQRMDRIIRDDPQIGDLGRTLKPEEIESLLSFCLPIQRRKPDAAAELRHRQDELALRLREQQKPVLNLVANNDRVLVEGGAGTGKSLIGMEVAKQMACAGLRTGYFCYNRLVGMHAKRELESQDLPGLFAGSVSAWLMKLVGIVVPNGADAAWWDETLPHEIAERLCELDADTLIERSFDYLVIDEAQDIMARSKLWDCLDLLLDGGFNNGRCLVLGDFVNQVLKEPEEVESALVKFRKMAVRWPLLENCRNYKAIGSVALQLSASDPETWSGFMREGGGLQSFDLIPYNNAGEQVQKVQECIRNARLAGFQDADITLLTFCSIDRSVIRQLATSGITLAKAEDLDTEFVRYSTINAYKGMENKVIIITDVALNPVQIDHERTRFYTGMTRATERLYIMCNHAATRTMSQWLQG